MGNRESLTETLAPDGPDLIVTGIVVTPAMPTAGVQATVCVTVQNAGNRPVTYGNNFYVDGYVDRMPAPRLHGDIAWGVQGSWYGLGASRTSCAPYTFTAGTHQLYAQADTDDSVAERSESNNVRGPQGLSVGGSGALGGAGASGESGPRPTPTPSPGDQGGVSGAGTMESGQR